MPGHRAERAVEHPAAQAAAWARRTEQSYELPPGKPATSRNVDELVVIYHNWDEIRRLMWDYVSIVRTNKRLQRAAARLRNLKREVQEFYWNFRVTSELLELRNLVETASLIVDMRHPPPRKPRPALHAGLPEPDRARAPGIPCCGGCFKTA